MSKQGREISDVIGMPNYKIINGLLLIADGFIDFDDEASGDENKEEVFDFEVFALETASARIISLSKLAYLFGVGFFVSNSFWIYNYLTN